MLIQFSRGQFLDLLWPQILLVLRVEPLVSWSQSGHQAGRPFPVRVSVNRSGSCSRHCVCLHCLHPELPVFLLETGPCRCLHSCAWKNRRREEAELRTFIREGWA